MDADAKLDALVRGDPGVALDEAVLHLDRAADRVDHAAKLDETAVAGALDDAPMMRGDGGIDQIAAQAPKPRQGAILVGAGEPAVADHVGDQDRRDFPGLAHGVWRAPRPASRLAQKIIQNRFVSIGRHDRTPERSQKTRNHRKPPNKPRAASVLAVYPASRRGRNRMFWPGAFLLTHFGEISDEP